MTSASLTTRPLEDHSICTNESIQAPLLDITRISQVELDLLINAVLPPVPDDWEQIRDLVLSQMITCNPVNCQWKCLPEGPKYQKDPEQVVFRFVSEIFEGIKAIASGGKSNLMYTVDQDETPRHTNTPRPDGYLYRPEADPSTQDPGHKGMGWANIILPMEFKKDHRVCDEQDDFAKIVWSIHHIMRKDPRRRFTFGLTIENIWVRLWFGDRCGVAVSTRFDINESWEKLARIIVCMIRASDNELGYDLDMRPAPWNGGPQYDITVRSREENQTYPTVYRTTQVLSDVGARNMLGRGTRVWKVRELVNGEPQGREYALKDVWVHLDCRPEHEILCEIKRNREEYARYFLTVAAARYVPATLNNLDEFDNTLLTTRYETQPVVNKVIELHPHSARTFTPSNTLPGDSSTNRNGSPASVGQVNRTDTSDQPELWDRHRFNVRPRQHYRIVFGEVGTPVHELRNFADVITALEGGLEGLRALHLGGLVHRDISSGNIMLLRDPEPRGVILDFEYAKNVHLIGPHDAKTGTLAFMACEAEARMFSELSPTGSVVPFRQNALHDLESIWWLTMFMIFYLVHPLERRTPEQHSNYQLLFKTTEKRHSFWTSPDVFGQLTSHLIQVKNMVDIMLKWKNELKRSYEATYALGNFYVVNQQVLDVAYSECRKAFGQLREAWANHHQDFSTLSDLPHLSPSVES